MGDSVGKSFHLGGLLLQRFLHLLAPRNVLRGAAGTCESPRIVPNHIDPREEVAEFPIAPPYAVFQLECLDFTRTQLVDSITN